MALGALAGRAVVQLGVDMHGFRRDMSHAERQFVGSTNRMGHSATRAGFTIKRGLGIASGVVGAVGGVYLLERALRAAWTEMQQGERIAAQTEAAIKSTGGVANVTARDVEGLATGWQRLSGVDNEITQHGANILLTFRGIKNEVGAGNDIFNQSVESLLDMGFALHEVGAAAEGGGGGLQATAIRLGKALNDPIRGVTALRRVGVQFTRDQENMIKKLVESGHVLEAQKIILAELQAEFGGSARAAGETFPQALERLRNTAAELAATYLTALVPAMQDAAAWVQRQIDAFAGNEEAQAAFREQVEEVVESVKGLVGGANDVAQALGGWEDVLKILIALKFARILLGWAAAMRQYRNATLGAAGATAALGIAQGGLLGGGVARAGKGLLGGLLGRGALVGAGALAGTAGAVALGSVGAILVTPGASGAKEGDRRGQRKALIDGEYAEDYPWLTIGFGMAARGDASPAVLKIIKSMGNGPWSENTMRAADRQLRRRLDTGGGGSGPHRTAEQRAAQGKNRPSFVPPNVDLSSETQLALAQAERSGNPVKIERALNMARRELNTMLRQATLTDEERIQLLNAVAGVEAQIAQIEQDRRDAAQTAADERKAAAEERKRAIQEERQAAHEAKTFGLERKLSRAEETERLTDDLKALNALRAYQRRWRDNQKRGSEDWQRAQSDLDSTNARIRDVRRSQRQRIDDFRRSRLEEKVARAEETEGAADDIRALENLRAYWARKRGAHAKYSEEWLAAQSEIDDLNRQIRGAKKKGSDDKSSRDVFQFTNEFLRLQSEYGPNFFPNAGGTGKKASGAVTVEQNFTTAPTDYFREARFALGAAKAVFDG